MNATDKVLLEMLREDTGEHMLDSGGAYGRQWQRNQRRRIEEEPEATLDCSYGEPEVTYNTYYWLRTRLEFNAELTDQYMEFACSEPQGGKPHLASMQEFADIYGDPDSILGIPTVNTYNHESLLDQVLQYTMWTDREDGTTHVLLQVHGGCDVRGGYTKPKAFDLPDKDEFAMVFDSQAFIGTADGKYSWFTDNGHHWYGEGRVGEDELQTCAFRECETDEEAREVSKTPGTVGVGPEGTGYYLRSKLEVGGIIT